MNAGLQTTVGRVSWRWLVLLLAAVAAAWLSYRLQPPREADLPLALPPLGQAPAEFGSHYGLTSLDNPLRRAALAEGEAAYVALIETGRVLYYQDCFYCHGDPRGVVLPPGQAPGLSDLARAMELQEAFVFWRDKGDGGDWHGRLAEADAWRVASYLFDALSQPSAAQAALSVPQGMALYRQRCRVCHGEQGRGDGPAADRLYPRPRDFSLGLFKYKTSPGALPPRDEDLVATLESGLHGTAMPAWGELLSAQQMRSLIPIIKSFDVSGTWAPEDADEEAFDAAGRYLGRDFRRIEAREPLDGQVPYSAASVARGEKVLEKICSKCHGAAGRGNITSGKRLKDDWGRRIWPRDLTHPWTWRVSNVPGGDAEARAQTVRNIYTRLSIGIPGTPMPAHRAAEAGNRDAIAREDRWHVANFVYSLRDVVVPPGGEALLRARYLAGELPQDADDPAWLRAAAVRLPLQPNVGRIDRNFTPLNDSLTVRSLYNDERIAFLLTLDDRTDSRPGEPVSSALQDRSLPFYADAVAIQVPHRDSFQSRPAVLRPVPRLGESAVPTTLWYWNAGSVSPPGPPASLLFDSGGNAGEIHLRRDDTSLRAAGRWQAGQWHVVLSRPRQGDGAHPDVAFEAGGFIPIAFAAWDGSNGEALNRYSLTPWYWLVLQPPSVQERGYGLPLVVGLAVLLLGGLLLRRRGSRP